MAYAIHSDNFVWGRAQNPWNRTRSCGGSSGGEAGIIAAKCAPLSLGSDIGGSIRIPCSFTGVRGFKPTGNRASLLGCRCNLPDSFTPFNHIAASIGPIGKSIDDLKTVLEIQFSPSINKYDPFTGPRPFREELY